MHSKRPRQLLNLVPTAALVLLCPTAGAAPEDNRIVRIGPNGEVIRIQKNVDRELGEALETRRAAKRDGSVAKETRAPRGVTKARPRTGPIAQASTKAAKTAQATSKKAAGRAGRQAASKPSKPSKSDG